MTKEQALTLVTQVFSQFKGTRDEHIALQQAEEVLKKLVEPTPKK